MTDPTWKILPDLVVRHAGFPFALLKRLNLPDLGQALDEVTRLREAVETSRAHLLSNEFPAAVAETQENEARKLLSRLRSQVGRRKALASLPEKSVELPPGGLREGLSKLGDLAQQLLDADQKARTLYDQQRPEVSIALRETFRTEPWLAEAIWVSNPDLHARSFGKFVDTDRSIKKAQERRFATYLHRFCAKNDTASFFGPMGYGSLFDDRVSSVAASLPAEKYVDRKVYPSFWLVDALAEMAASDPILKPYLIARVHPMLERSSQGVRLGERVLKLPTEAVEMIQSVMQDDLSHRVVAQTQAQAELLDRLVARGLITLSFPVPSTVLDPMGWLRNFLSRETKGSLPEDPDILAVLDRFDQQLQQLQSGHLPKRILAARQLEQIAEEHSLPTRRAAGGTYADRTLTYEECNGGGDLVRFSVDASKALEQRLEPTLKLMGAYGQRLAQDVRKTCQEAFEQLANGRKRMSYLSFINGLAELEASDQLKHGTRAAAFSEALQRLAQKRLKDGVVRLSQEDVDHLAGPDDNCGLYTSPDLMFAAASPEEVAGPDSLIVLGETHQFLATWGSQMMFHPKAEQAYDRAAHLVDEIGLGDRLATVLHKRVHKGLVHESFPGVFVEVSGAAGDHTDRMALRDLEVVQNDRGLFLEDRETGRALGLYHSGDDKIHLWAFAPPRVSPAPIRLGAHTPRILVGDVVYQRARWELDPETTAKLYPQHDEFQAMRDMRWLAYERGIPRRFFLRVASEKKPLFVDLDSPNACAIAHELLRSNGEGSVSEMLPDTDELWLRDEAGAAYCLELRTTCYRPGPATWMPEVEHA